MSAPTGSNGDITPSEATERIEKLVDDDRDLHGIIDTGGETEYAHIYLVSITGEYNGNEMLWIRYVWLSKPGAFESDMYGENGISIRVVDGMEDNLTSIVAAACNALQSETKTRNTTVFKEV